MLPLKQTAQDRPDICARVLHLKLTGLLQKMSSKVLFVNTMTWVRLIEFLKRGLAKTHCIFFLDRNSRQVLNSPDNVDRVISTEIFGDDDSELQEIILNLKVHTACGDINPDSLCMKQPDIPVEDT